MDKENLILMADEELTPVDKMTPNRYLPRLSTMRIQDAIRYLRDEIEGLKEALEREHLAG